MRQQTNRCKTLGFPVSVTKLDQGITVVHQNLTITPVTVVDVWVKAGARMEPHHWKGTAHFLEHMIFKGSSAILPGHFDQVIEHNGGITNAFTSHDYAHFFLTVAGDHLTQTLPYLGEILLQASIPDKEFILERDVILEEIRLSYDDPDWVCFQSLCETLYQHHPYGRSILGHETQLRDYSAHQLRCFHRTHYQPHNMTVVVVGNIEEKTALSLVEKTFSDFSVPSECPPHEIISEPPLKEIRRNHIYFPRLAHGRLLMGWIGPGIDQLDEGIGLDLLSVILAGARTSRLVQELREDKQLVMDIESSFSLQQDSSLFTIGAWLDPQNLEAVEAIICDRLNQLQQEPITQAELNKAKRLLCHDYIFSTETPSQLAGLYGYYQTLADAKLAFSYPILIQQYTAEKLQQMACQYLSTQQYAITIMKPC
ncbi:peptidase, M16B family [Crocosphaera subtropica ATCC 51142]|uniref:Peptidase, M16B family n=1 Tax=Crocosphaera subtropica (strain ATCC 51142 / BH68) TaxID=43989 RepID=B1WV55_CROS5|nr:pitrilysin family protein [Crocosphaera subtropica]ACB52252.1 peptidase, M16B family [Crocosphaera subtropica ATCC 51142]